MNHACQRCGASCEGLRVRVRPDEREPLARHAALLGVEHPFAGDWLRQSWGRCVFHRDGCRLHAEIGVHAKPAVCRTFPVLPGAIDPACFHPGRPTGERLPVDWEDLLPGEQTRQQLDRLPLAAVLDGPLLGPTTAAALQPLVQARPSALPEGSRADLERHLHTLLTHRLLPHSDPVRAVVGGLQLGGPGILAPWVRFLKLGLIGR